MLSIIIPVYNSEKYLYQCIESILNQSFADIEIIVVDDGSSDLSLEICRDFVKKDNRIRLFEINHQGPYNARKYGVMKSSGNYITFIDSDDFISYESFSFAEEDMKSFIDIISFDIFRFYNNDDIRCETSLFNEKIYNKEEMRKFVYPVMIWNTNKRCCGLDPALWNKIYKRDILIQYYLKCDSLTFHYGEDVAVVYPIIDMANNISFHHKAYYFHRQRNKNEIAPYLLDNEYLNKLHDLYLFLLKKMGCNYKAQIEMFYAYSAQLIYRKYSENMYLEDKLFPFDKIEKNEKVIIYGAGKLGKTYMNQLNKISYCHIVYWADRDYEKICDNVGNPENIKFIDFDKIVIAIEDNNTKEKVKKYLQNIGVKNSVIVC